MPRETAGVYLGLPLLERVVQEDSRYAYTGRQGLVQLQPPRPSRIPNREPEAGEQYRFHFDMTLCIGCKCCEVACNEQNGNPADIRWRRVGEVEAGQFPFTLRSYLSMGCNHCIEAACLHGCPVDAYTKDAATGIVLHDADMCIGCQYCTWNCPYGVPQYNEERGVVGKCDLCHGRLSGGDEPACVSACPQGAIQVEIVNIIDWGQQVSLSGNAPGMPAAEDTVSTTRITIFAGANHDFQKGDYNRVRPEHPHWPLVFVLVLTQMAAGGFFIAWITGALDAVSLLAPLVALHAALGVSLLHLGRPLYAWRAVKMWKRSWLSREVLAFSVFAGCATPAFGHALLGWPFVSAVTLAASITGFAGVLCSAFIYMVPARPVWNSWRTIVDFYLTGLTLGPLVIGLSGSNEIAQLALWPAASQVLFDLMKLTHMRRSEEFELRQSARLLLSDRSWVFRLRLVLALAAVLPWFWQSPLSCGIALGLCLAGQICSRYLFFTSVVPRNIAATFFGTAREAA